jgi:hypothetical protein
MGWFWEAQAGAFCVPERNWALLGAKSRKPGLVRNGLAAFGPYHLPAEAE